jgi:hypothetical protein
MPKQEDYKLNFASCDIFILVVQVYCSCFVITMSGHRPFMQEVMGSYSVTCMRYLC